MARLTKHFSSLTEAEQERLAILIEECGEVIKCACKILRHGYESFNPTIPMSRTNRKDIEQELGDLSYAITRMEDVGDVDRSRIEDYRISKPERMARYLHHQSPEGRR